MHVLLLLATALAGKTPLTVRATGPGGAPLPSTMIRFHEEGTIHVMSDDGTFEVSTIVRTDGTERDLSMGGQLVFDVFAPGHGPSLMIFELKAGKANKANIILSKSVFHTSGSLEGNEAVALARRWEEAQLAWWKDRTEANRLLAERLRAATASKARVWLEALGQAPHSDATRLCRMTAPDISICGEE